MSCSGASLQLLLLLVFSGTWADDNGKTRSNNDSSSGNIDNAPPSHCSRLPKVFPFHKKDLIAHTYNASTESLTLDFTDLIYKFCDDDIYSAGKNYSVRIDLTSASRGKDCDSLSQARVQARQHLDPASPIARFLYVQGRYQLRFSECVRDGASSSLAACELVACSKPAKFSPTQRKNAQVCGQPPSNVSAFKILDNSQVLDFHTCSVELNAFVPLCTSQQRHDRALVHTVEVGLDDECSLEDLYRRHDASATPQRSPVVNTTIPVRPCRTQDDTICTVPVAHGLLRHELYDLSRNSSYCLFYQLLNPHCGRRSAMRDPQHQQTGCLFYTQRVTCDLLKLSPFSLWTEPMFICVVSLTLVLSLALLMWTVVQCSKKRPETPVQQPMKKPPRSLTEDDLEHISRLPSQEIVLVYFPDTKRFKELNRKFRNWLITLDVNDVKDIYDEKCSEDVLRDPEKWVRQTLGGPEKRIILVCSRLAYECLATVKKGVSSPKFVETDPHFGLLTRSIMYLDREMRGNYRNLICVRYEDLKICDRQYSSEAFNIVPGTEYVLPQHLEDVYRWIHPRDPKPECWSEFKPEVRELLDMMRKYRHHDDNMFTVQFTNQIGSPSDDG